jgi:uncharacterized protein
MERIGDKPGQRDRWRTGRSVLDLYRDLAQARFGQALVRIVLFGSRARGDNRPESDWDVAVFLSGEVTPGDQRQVSAIGHDVMCETGALIQSVALPSERWQADDELARHIRHEGVRVYG